MIDTQCVDKAVPLQTCVYCKQQNGGGIRWLVQDRTDTHLNFPDVSRVQPSLIINGLLCLLFIVEVAHEDMAAIEANLDEDRVKLIWLDCGRIVYSATSLIWTHLGPN